MSELPTPLPLPALRPLRLYRPPDDDPPPDPPLGEHGCRAGRLRCCPRCGRGAVGHAGRCPECGRARAA